MGSSNEFKNRLLGQPFGTATSKLRKSLLFSLAGQLDLLGCYRCQEEISLINDFSIEHKVAWSTAPNPIESFFDLNNIAFSHIKCNIGAANSQKKIYSSLQEKNQEKNRKKYSDPVKYQSHLEYKRNWYRKNKPSNKLTGATKSYL